jgi:tripartite-type tricarboxylate transporter receptor subunit TctC
MKLPHRQFLHLAVAAAAVSLMVFTPSGAAWSQAVRTVKIVVPFPPGGSADILARLLGEQVGKAQGLSVVIENRPGGGASIAYEAVARAAPDGNTLVINGNSVVINPHLRKVNYDPLTSFEPVCYLVSSPQVYVVSPASPYRTLPDLIAAARARPGEITFATVGPATTQHIGFEQLRHAADLKVIYVPYPGGAPAVNALLGGHVAAVLANYSEVVE